MFRSALLLCVLAATAAADLHDLQGRLRRLGGAVISEDLVSCEQNTLQSAINAASNGDTIICEDGTYSWTANAVTITDKAITLKAETSRGVIIQKNNSTSQHLISVTESTAGSVVIRGFKFVGGSGDGFGSFAAIAMSYTSGGEPIVVYDNEWNDEVAGVLVRTKGGLIFGNFSNMTEGSDMQFLQCKRLENSVGLPDWELAPTKGADDTTGKNNIYLEDNNIVMHKNQATDSDGGCRMVVRGNTFNNSAVNGHGPDTGNPPMGNRHIEVYNNTFETHYPPTEGCTVLPPSPMNWFIKIRGGSGLVFNNVLPNLGNCATGFKGEVSITLHAIRVPTGPASVRCWNGGYPMPRNTGWGHNGSAYVIEPIYMHGNTGGTDWLITTPHDAASPSGCDGATTEACPMCPNGDPAISVFIQENRELYIEKSSFDGTVGVGVGSIASRPATCTTGVAYWATDEGEWDSTNPGADGQRYDCTATDTWTLSYIPKAYPHPLRAALGLP